MSDSQRSSRFTDPRAIRAVAHPARLALLEALQGGREMTATECSFVTGLSPSATSYHLKALARYGLVEAAPGRQDARERPWRAIGREIDIRSESNQTTGIVNQTLMRTFWERDLVVIEEFLAHERDDPTQWNDAVLSNGDYWLTPEEAFAVSRRLEHVLEVFRERGRNGSPAGSRRVRVAYLVVPRHDRPL